MEQEREKRFSPPEAVPGLDWEQTEEEAAPDPLDRPDLYAEEDELSEPVWTQPDMPTEPCPCCGADIPQNQCAGGRSIILQRTRTSRASRTAGCLWRKRG